MTCAAEFSSHSASGRRETTLNRLIARSGPPKQRLDMNQGAVDHGKAAVLSGEGEEQIRAAKHDSFGTARLAQRLPIERKTPR